jgi:hypothetical protein
MFFFLDCSAIAHRHTLQLEALHAAEEAYAKASVSHIPKGHRKLTKFNNIVVLYSDWSLGMSTGDDETDWDILRASFVLAGLLGVLGQCWTTVTDYETEFHHWYYGKCVTAKYRNQKFGITSYSL